MRAAYLLAALFLLSPGCARMIVQKAPRPDDTGIRFYRPKPYLYIGPSDQKDQVTMHIEYLPDYSEEYSIRMNPGLGTTKLTVALEHGWNLTSVNAETDQKYAEILGSAAQLAGVAVKTVQVAADSDVPLGYYEAVLATNECGHKELMGWRYVGIVAAGCPVTASVCRRRIDCGAEPLYAIVYDRGHALRMKRLDSLGTPSLPPDELPPQEEYLGPPAMPPAHSWSPTRVRTTRRDRYDNDR